MRQGPWLWLVSGPIGLGKWLCARWHRLRQGLWLWVASGPIGLGKWSVAKALEAIGFGGRSVAVVRRQGHQLGQEVCRRDARQARPLDPGHQIVAGR